MGPAVFADCFLPRTQATAPREPVDPLVAPVSSTSAWGPAAEHARGWEDTSSWKKAVYRQNNGNSDAARFSVSGGNVDLTSTPKWQQFGNGGGHPGHNVGKMNSHNHYRNTGLLGVPASQEVAVS